MGYNYSYGASNKYGVPPCRACSLDMGCKVMAAYCLGGTSAYTPDSSNSKVVLSSEDKGKALGWMALCAAAGPRGSTRGSIKGWMGGTWLGAGPAVLWGMRLSARGSD